MVFTRLHPHGTCVTSVSQQITKNSAAATADFNNQVLSVEGGLRYVTPSGAKATYTYRHGFGEFMDRPEPIASSQFDTKFDDTENELRFVWPATVKTSVDGRVGYFSRKHAHFSDRNFAGFVGSFNVNWDVTSKTRVTAGWARRSIQYSNVSQLSVYAGRHHFFQ